MRSQVYNNILSVNELARGGEAIVYRLDYIGNDEVVVKTTILDDHLQDNSFIQNAYKDIMTET